MEPIIFAKAGKVLITPFNSDGTLDMAGKGVGADSIVESVHPTIAPKFQDIPDGNSDWPAATVTTGVDGKIQVTFSTYHADLHATLIGQPMASLTNKPVWALGVDYTIDATAGTVTLLATPVGDPIVRGLTGTAYTKVASGPTATQYSITGSVLTFAVSEKGKPVKVSYQRTAATATEFGLPESSTFPMVNIVIDGEARNLAGTSVQDCNILVDRAMLDGSVDFPDMKRAPGNWVITLKVVKPRGGFLPLDVIFAPNAAV
jgi:hypothetical protein